MRVTDRLRVEHGVYLVQPRHLEERVEAGAPPAKQEASPFMKGA